jgi:S-adenosyl methyltransferase
MTAPYDTSKPNVARMYDYWLGGKDNFDNIVDAQTAQAIVASFSGALAPGSYMIISVGYATGQDGADFVRTDNTQNGQRIYGDTWEQITALFDGLELVPPGNSS